MRNNERREAARLRAEAYAPMPQDTRMMYGLVSVSLLFLGLVGIGWFYSVDLWREPLAIAGLVALAFGLGLLARRVTMERHRSAHRVEYDRGMARAAATANRT